MAHKPNIIVSIVHIEGPLKGEIQEFSDAEIRIGRNIGYHVQFPKEVLIVSRDHARIIRDGNRFKLVNNSEDLTYLNGKPVELGAEAYLKSGDWLMFAQGGPKVSFLTKVDESGSFAPPKRPVFEESRPEIKAAPGPVSQPELRQDPLPVNNIPVVDKPIASIQQTQTPLIIRYGPTLQRFKSLPVTIGSNETCDFTLKHLAVKDQHIQIFSNQGQYFVKDLTGQQSALINGLPVNDVEALQPDDQLMLSNQGPKFRFLGEGRLDEIDDQ